MCKNVYRVTHVLVNMGWVVFDLGVHHLAQPLLPNSHHSRQNWTERGTLKFHINPTQFKSRWDTLYKVINQYITLLGLSRR